MADLNQAREHLTLSEVRLESSNNQLVESIKTPNEQVANLRSIAAESEILEKWIQSVDYYNSPTLSASVNATKKINLTSMKIFPFDTSGGSRYHSHVWAVSKPTSEFVMWLITKMPREWWMDYNKSVKRLLDQRQVDPKMIQICLNDDGVMFLKLKWPVEA